MMFIDTHAHLYASEFQNDRLAVIQRAKDAGVGKIFLPNIDMKSIPLMHQLHRDAPDFFYPMMGLHPCSVQQDVEEQLTQIFAAFDPKVHCAIGEIGIDLYWDKSFLAQQILAFKTQIEWAKKLELPIIIHARDSFDQIFEVMDRLNDERLTGIFHCFTGTKKQAEHILSYRGFKLGIGGVVTFKNGGIHEFLHELPLDQLVLETDAPYLAPVPHRGKRNESSYIPIIAERVATCFQLPLHKVAEITTNAALEVFKMK
jgi:TatD DNase family protein